MINPEAQNISRTQACYFDELHIRARSPWHREKYNEHLDAAKARGLSSEEARAHAIHLMQSVMGDSGIRKAAR